MEQGINAYQNQDQWDKMYNLKRGLAVASMPIEQAIGYGLGAFLNNYFTRGNKKKGLEAAEAVISEPISSNEATSDGILSGIENKGSKESDILGDNSDYVRQVMETNASIPEGTTLNQYNQMANDNRTISAYQNMQLPTVEQQISTTNKNKVNTTTVPKESYLLGDSNKLKVKDDLSMKYALGYYNQPMSFNNAVASSNEVAANSLPEYLKPRIDYYVNIINSAKEDYMKAQANNDTEGMQSANAQANAAREELNKLGVDSSYFGADKTQEQSQKSMADLNYYKLPIAQNVSPFQQQIADKVHSEIIAAKFNYDNATNENERLLAQLQAKKARDLANQYGLDMSSYGADITAERSLLASLNESPKFNMQDASSIYTANPVSTQEYWQDIYERVLKSGVGETAAREIATQKAAAYQSRKINDLSSQFIQYGINSDGSVGDLGMGILAQLRNENPDAYTQLLSAYGMPKDVFAFNQQIQRDNNNAQNQLIAMNNQGRINSELQNQKYKETANLQAIQAQQQVTLYQIKAQIDREYQNASLVDRMDIMRNKLIEYGVNPQEAGLMAAGLYSVSKKGKSTTSNKEEQKLASDLSGLTFDLLNSARNDDAMTSEETLQNYQKELAKLAPQMEDDVYNFYSNTLIYVFNFLREKKAGNENQAREYWKYIPEDVRKEYLPEYSD
ncbi:hypothetical protein [uncultured Megamonas sp.]|uniref:hypothetical protein n=1 Tax=uncultured Megamonas sp. TaxID=286140 RepID=UPI0025991B2C|nr:hypothetical protein [uncultured Megamonas sp.]